MTSDERKEFERWITNRINGEERIRNAPRALAALAARVSDEAYWLDVPGLSL